MSGVVAFAFGIYEAAKKEKVASRILFFVGALALLVACDQAWQDEHRDVEVLVAEKSSISSERDFWKEQSYEKDASLRARDELLAKNYGVLASTESSLATLSNKLAGLQEPLKITAHLLPTQSSTQAQYRGTFLVLTNKAITPVRLLVTCDAEIQAGGQILGTGAMMGGGWAGRVTRSNKQSGIGILSPAWTPTNPLLVTIYSTEAKLGFCSFDEK